LDFNDHSVHLSRKKYVIQPGSIRNHVSSNESEKHVKTMEKIWIQTPTGKPVIMMTENVPTL